MSTIETKCEGNGYCLGQTGLYKDNGEEIYSQDQCIHNCKPMKCPCYYYCHNVLPQIVLDCNEGFCMNCSTTLYNLYRKDHRDKFLQDWRKK